MVNSHSAMKCTGGFAVCFYILAILTVIPLVSVMIYQRNNGHWTTELIRELDRLNAVGKELNKSWSAEPFVSVLALDSETYPMGCPITHEELIYDIWPGTTMMCDCLEREEGLAQSREYFLDIKCIRGKDKPHNSEDCFDIMG